MDVYMYPAIPEQYYEEILDILTCCDRDFLPPLSARESTTQKAFSAETTSGKKPVSYCREMMQQNGFLAFDDGRVAGFLSFKKDYTCDAIGKETFPNVYISTLAVHPDYRGRGIAKQLYAAILSSFAECNAYTRTWSTNQSQMKILPGLQFEEIKRIKNDRGQGIDTVYFYRSRTKNTD